MLGKPVIKGTRVTVELILRKLSEGATEAGLFDAYPRLTHTTSGPPLATWRIRGSDGMAELKLLERITADPAIFGGKPIVRGMRISVELVLNLLSQGETVEAILADYPDLDADHIRLYRLCTRRHCA